MPGSPWNAFQEGNKLAPKLHVSSQTDIEKKYLKQNEDRFDFEIIRYIIDIFVIIILIILTLCKTLF